MTIVVVPSFTAPPDFPTLSDKPAGTYNSKAYAWAQAMPTSGNSMKAIGDATRTNALDAASSATAASTSASNAGSARDAAQTARDAAQAAKAAAEASAASALASPGTSATSATSLTVGTGSKTLAIQPGKVLSVGQWVIIAQTSTPGNYMAGQITAHNGLTGSLTVNVTATGGSGTAASWVVALTAPVGQVLAEPLIEYSARASNTQLVAADSGKLIDITGGTFTQTFAAASALGAGWYCYVRNSGTGDVTLDPNGSEQIDGITSFIMYPGSARMVVCDGAAFRSIPISGGTKTFTATANYVWAPGIQAWDADLMGGGAGGGGGARAASIFHGGGGGAGERLLTRIMKSSVVVGVSSPCTVGAGGTGGNGATADNQSGVGGTNGGTTSLAGVVSVANGLNGAGGTTSAHGAGGGGGGRGIAATIGTGQARATAANTTEWAGPNGTPGDGGAAALAVLGGQRGGIGGGTGGAVAGANGTSRTGSTPGWGGGGGGGNVNGSSAGKGGDGAPGYITIVEVI